MQFLTCSSCVIFIGIIFILTAPETQGKPFRSQRALSTVNAIGSHSICNKIPGLSPQQRTICQSRPKALVAVGQGAALGLQECKYQFSGMRWNCSSPRAANTLFGHHHAHGSQEAAFSSAITSAGVAYAVTQSCSQGNLLGCGCDTSKTAGEFSKEGFKWTGCSVDWKYGLNFAGRFLDAGEIEENSRTLMNLHNNRAGRKVLKDKMKLTCKCHGTSGACTIKSCWTDLPDFRDLGSHLMNKFKRAKHVLPVHGRRALKPLYLKLKADSDAERVRKPRQRDLVYLDNSPNYCEYDSVIGSMGTRGRKCNVRSSGADNCDNLCCGRGYDTYKYNESKRCNCKFHWCCEVTCDQCNETITIHTCK